MTHCAHSVPTGSRLYLTVDHCGHALPLRASAFPVCLQIKNEAGASGECSMYLLRMFYADKLRS